MVRKMLATIGLGFACLVSSCASSADAPLRTWLNPKDGMRFVWVPAGSFTVEVPVNSNDPNDAGKTSPQTIAFEQGYWVGRTEATVGQFRRFVRETGYVTDAEKAGNRWTWKDPGFPQRDDHPVVYISFVDARQYARWAGVELPTEAQWLYACWASEVSPLLDDRRVWHRLNTEGTGTRPVARKLPNAWGLYDMVGNAREYCRVGLAPPYTHNAFHTTHPKIVSRFAAGPGRVVRPIAAAPAGFSKSSSTPRSRCVWRSATRIPSTPHIPGTTIAASAASNNHP